MLGDNAILLITDSDKTSFWFKALIDEIGYLISGGMISFYHIYSNYKVRYFIFNTKILYFYI